MNGTSQCNKSEITLEVIIRFSSLFIQRFCGNPGNLMQPIKSQSIITLINEACSDAFQSLHREIDKFSES